MDPRQLTDRLKEEASRTGFSLAGACPAVTPRGIHRFHEWLDRGYAGQMHYLADREQAYSHPKLVLDSARSLLLLAMNYRTAEPAATRAGQGRVSRYAWGGDYHDLIHQRLRRLLQVFHQLAPQASARGVVDTAPLLEREFAQLAGLGWIGKNTLLLNKNLGSWFFLAALVTDQELAYDEPHETDHCGTCRACLDACPTQAFVEPYVLDSRRCISYLTIELRTSVPGELRAGVGDWLLGCDVCQEVCPWNHRAPTADEPALQPADGMNPLDLAGLFDLDEAAFRRRFRHTPLWRPKRRGILRNAAIVLGNHPRAEALPALVHGLSDSEPLVRGACAWALGRYVQGQARAALLARLACEPDPLVRTEIEQALRMKEEGGSRMKEEGGRTSASSVEPRKEE
ncbi:MAG: tRNA epoxyqueuosine(34) reductase QueG [Pirellulales bacterium]